MNIKGYKLFLENKQSNEEIDSICKKYRISNYTINEDGTVDVDGDVSLSWLRLTKIPLKFGKVTGFFSCNYNKLTSLEGCPKFVGGVFSCSGNQLTTLDGGPETVLGEYYCSNNQLKTLEGGPEVVIGGYYCYNNKLVSFKGFPEDFDGYISIIDNPVYNLIENIPQEKWNKFIYWCNEFDAIDDQGKVIPERMEEVYNKLGLEYED